MGSISVNDNGVQQISISGTPTVNVGTSALPTGASTSAKQDTGNTSLSSIDGKLTALKTANPEQDDPGMPVRLVPTALKKCGFSNVSASGLDTDDVVQIGTTPAGMTVSQSGGNLVVTSTTNTNEEFLARSTWSFNGAFNFWFSQTQSQRIANNTIGVYLADLVGSGLSYTINSATSVTVSAVPGSWSAKNVGQSMQLGGMTVAGSVPGRYAIASVSGSDLTFTVSGFPSSGSGTLCLWGYNYIQAECNNTTATNMSISAQDRGWRALAENQATINTISSGHMVQIRNDGLTCLWEDQSLSSSTGASSARGSRAQDLPRPEVDLHVFLRFFTGTSAPASGTTWTVGFIAVEDTIRQKIHIAGMSRSAFNMTTLASTATVTAAGANADDSATLASPVVVGGRTINASPTASANNDTGNLTMDLRRRLLMYGPNPREIADVNIATVTNTTETTLIAAVASISHDITFLMLSNDGATLTRCDIRDSTGGTIRFAPVVPIGGTVVVPIGSQPAKQSGTNANWTIQASASTTSLRVTAISVRS